MSKETTLEETTPKKPTKPRGRPTDPTIDKVDQKFHLVLMDEEMNLFKAAAKVEGINSIAAFIRSAIDHVKQHPALLKKNIPKGLMPSNEDPSSYHYTLLLTSEGKAAVDMEDLRHRCEFIRTAALSKALRVTTKDPTFEAALIVLKAAKGAK